MKKHILTLLLVLATLSAAAQDAFNFLNMVDNDAAIHQIATEGLVIKFVDGNAVATTSASTTVTIALADLSRMEFTNVQKADDTYDRGDVDANGVVDIDDLNILINIILNKDNADRYEGRAYVAGGDVVDIDDLNVIINIILHKDND